MLSRIAALALVVTVGIIFSILLIYDIRFFMMALAAAIYVLFLVRYPDMALFMAFLAIVSVFSIMDEDFLRVPYLFRLRDIFFM